MAGSVPTTEERKGQLACRFPDSKPMGEKRSGNVVEEKGKSIIPAAICG
jgi:hypothetical protein